jgi:magnesium transporter
MAESSATRIAITTVSGTSLRRFASTDLDEILSKVDPAADTFIHVVHADTTSCAAILEHFGCPRGLAEHIDGTTTLELDTSSDRYLFKRFRFMEEVAGTGAASRNASAAGVLIRGSETDRFVEGSGSFVIGERFALLFEDGDGSPLVARAIENVLQRERELRARGIEYFVYRLAKTVLVDNYFGLMRRLLHRLQELEAVLLEGSTDTNVYREITRLRRELNPFERSLTQVAEFTAEVALGSPAVQGGFAFLAASLNADCGRLEKEFSMLRDRTSELIGTYRDNVNAQLNNVMRSLTVLSAMFLPLSFITSFYGMNFPNMPAFRWAGGFPLAVLLMLTILVGSLTYARRKKWI